MQSEFQCHCYPVDECSPGFNFCLTKSTCFASIVKDIGEHISERWGCFEQHDSSLLTCGTTPNIHASIVCCDTHLCNRNITPTFPKSFTIPQGRYSFQTFMKKYFELLKSKKHVLQFDVLWRINYIRVETST